MVPAGCHSCLQQTLRPVQLCYDCMMAVCLQHFLQGGAPGMGSYVPANQSINYTFFKQEGNPRKGATPKPPSVIPNR
jgi:hypothetical protein